MSWHPQGIATLREDDCICVVETCRYCNCLLNTLVQEVMSHFYRKHELLLAFNLMLATVVLGYKWKKYLTKSSCFPYPKREDINSNNSYVDCLIAPDECHLKE